jgi:hypothetical protein
MPSDIDVIFLGPSLDLDSAKQILPNALYLPPARMGDVLSVSQRLDPHSIGLIDGSFMSTMSVFHKELLYAIDQGSWVLGAGSMGALRAAECHRYGMIGLGEIFEKLVSGEIEDDDEVALTHADASAGYRPLSDAFVTIRATIEELTREDVLTVEQANILLGLQKRRWFPDRHLAGVISDAKDLGFSKKIILGIDHCLKNHIHDPKRDDAILLLKSVVELPRSPVPEEDRPGVCFSYPFQTTLSKDTLVQSEDGLEVSLDDIRRFGILHLPDSVEITNRARLDHALVLFSRWLGGELSDEELLDGRRLVAKHFGTDEKELNGLLSSLDLDEQGMSRFIQRAAHHERLAKSWLGITRQARSTTGYLDQLRLDGRYSEVKDAAAFQHAAAQKVQFEPMPSYETMLKTFLSFGEFEFPADFKEWLVANDLGSALEFGYSVGVAVRASHALFNTGLIQAENEFITVFDDDEPMMARGR